MGERSYDRRRRIRLLKRVILGSIAAAVIIPIVVSILLGIRVASLQNKVTMLEEALAFYASEAENIEGTYTTASVEESPRDAVETGALVDNRQQEDGTKKQIYLTFDDGPSGNTDEILDILKEYDVKATFFVVGKMDEHSVKAYQRIVAEGHTLAMHSYSHKYDEVYASKESFIQDLSMLQEYLYQVTGVWSRFYRFPGGSSNTVSTVDMQELMDYLDEVGIMYFDWNVSCGDASGGRVSVDTLVENSVSNLDNINRCMLLMHDATEKKTTVEALPEIIQKIQERGDTVFLPVTDETAPIHHVTTK